MDEYQNREDRQADDMLHFWVLWVLSKPGFCYVHLSSFFNEMQVLCCVPGSVYQQLSQRQGKQKSVFIIEVFIKKKINSFILRQERSQNLCHTHYLDLCNLKRTAANYHSVYPDRKYLTCFSCGPSVFSLFCLTTPSLSCPHALFAGGCKTPFVIWHFYTKVTAA